MTKQHFIAFAKYIRETVEEAKLAEKESRFDTANNCMRQAEAQARMVRSVAPQFNPNFKEATFLKACGL